MTYDIVFVVASVVAIAAALMVVLSPNPFISALSLIANLIALATLYLLLQSDFLAAAQVIVYAGAVMIMFLFVTAYLGGRADEPTGDRPVWQTFAALIAAAAIVAEIVFGVGRQNFLHGATVSDAFGAPQAIAATFLGRYVLAFEGDIRAAPGRGDRRRRSGHPETGDARGRRAGRVRGRPARAGAKPAVVGDGGRDALRRRHRGRPPRRRGHGRGGGRLMHVGVAWFISVSAILFGIGLYGVFTRRSPLILLLSVEIMLNACNLSLISFSRYLGQQSGQVFALVVMAVAASEVVVGLGLVVAVARRKADLDVDRMTGLRH